MAKIDFDMWDPSLFGFSIFGILWQKTLINNWKLAQNLPTSTNNIKFVKK